MAKTERYTHRKICFSPRGGRKRLGARGRRGTGEGVLKRARSMRRREGGEGLKDITIIRFAVQFMET